MKTLVAVAPELLGPASSAAKSVTATVAGGRWVAGWTGPSGDARAVTSAGRSGPWTPAAPAAVQASTLAGWLAVVPAPGGRVAVRTSRRVAGTRPDFPSAAIVVARETADGWADLAFSDDNPEAEVLAAAVAESGGEALVVYTVADGRGGAECRALRLSLKPAVPRPDAWRKLPDYPQDPGVAGMLAGYHRGVLIAAGGSNFRTKMPWEGGSRTHYDEIHYLEPGAAAWKTAGRLPEIRGYAAMVALPQGLLALGGENLDTIFSNSYWLRWTGSGVAVEPGPALPGPLSSAVAVELGGKVYLAGGYQPGPPRTSTSGFYCLDLAKPEAGWEKLPSWPGPARALGTIAVLNGAIYLISGIDMQADAEGKPVFTYLKDAYRYTPGRGWETLPDLPWSVIAAPAPAPVTSGPDRVFAFGGVDGRQVGVTPRDKRVPEDILYLDVAANRWRLWPEFWPECVCSIPTAQGTPGEWTLVGGETKAGFRSRSVLVWRPGS